MAQLCGPIGKSIENGITSLSLLHHQRPIVMRTTGNIHGPITRLISPGDNFGNKLKPFVFLDAFKMPAGPLSFKGFGYHPHSGIATVTVMLEGSMWYEETTSKGQLETGGVEFFRAASGAWHKGGPVGEDNKRGYQLWIALPEQQELSKPDSFYLKANEVKQIGPARLILGKYESIESPIPSTNGINYLDVRMNKNEQWTYNIPDDHTVAFIAVWKGRIKCNDDEVVNTDELAVFEESAGGKLHFESVDSCSFILGTAVKHPHDLILGSYSVHTSKENLIKGEQRIKEIGAEMKSKGLL